LVLITNKTGGDPQRLSERNNGIFMTGNYREKLYLMRFGCKVPDDRATVCYKKSCLEAITL